MLPLTMTFRDLVRDGVGGVGSHDHSARVPHFQNVSRHARCLSVMVLRDRSLYAPNCRNLSSHQDPCL